MKWPAFSFTLLLLITSVSAQGGGNGSSGGNGDNLLPETGSAWYLGGRPIRYCYELSSSFGSSEEEIKEAISDSFSLWKEYVARKHVFLKPNVIAMSGMLFQKCDGSEDLKFYFGSKLRGKDAAQKGIADDPTAISRRTGYDSKKGWGKGFIWVSGPTSDPNNAVNWSRPYALQAILTHELGHVFGCDHVEGTIMRADIASWVNKDYPNRDQAKLALTSIDYQRELVRNYYGGMKYQGEIHLHDSAVSARTFERFTGRKPVGRISAFLTTTTEKASSGEGVVITLKDEKSSVAFPVSFPVQIGAKELINYYELRETRIFKIANIGALYPEGDSRPGEVIARDGKRYLVEVSSNMGSSEGQYGPMEVTFIAKEDANVSGMLFESCPAGICLPANPQESLMPAALKAMECLHQMNDAGDKTAGTKYSCPSR